MIKDNSTLIIRNVDHRAPTDAGWYTCSAYNAIGWSSPAEAYLTVQSKSCFLLYSVSLLWCSGTKHASARIYDT